MSHENNGFVVFGTKYKSVRCLSSNILKLFQAVNKRLVERNDLFRI